MGLSWIAGVPSWICGIVRESLMKDSPHAPGGPTQTPLSKVQIRTLRVLATGAGQEEAAAILQTNVHTVKSRVALIGRKLNTVSAAHSIRVGYDLGYLVVATTGPPKIQLKEIHLTILRLLAEGKERKEIASILDMKIFELRRHTEDLYEALPAKNRCHLVNRGFQTRNLIPQTPQ